MYVYNDLHRNLCYFEKVDNVVNGLNSKKYKNFKQLLNDLALLETLYGYYDSEPWLYNYHKSSYIIYTRYSLILEYGIGI